MGQAQNIDSESFYKALDECNTDALQNMLKSVSNPKLYLHQVVRTSTRLPIEIVTYSGETPDRIVATLKLLISCGLDVNFVKPDTLNPPFSLIAIDSSPEVVKYLLEKGMKFDGEAQYPADRWCNHQVAHLIHNTPEPCSNNKFEQKEHPASYNHTAARLKLDLFNFIKDREIRNAFVRLMEKRVVLEYTKVTGEYPKDNLILEFPTLEDKKVKCQILYKTRIENNGSEDFSLSVSLPKKYSDTMLTFSAVYRVNAYDGNDTRPYKQVNGVGDMSKAVKAYFGLSESDFYGFLLLVIHHIDSSILVAPRAQRKNVLQPIIISPVPPPSWMGQVCVDWARAPEQDDKSASEDNGDGEF